MGKGWIYGFDADDTLWQNEQFFRLTEERFHALLAPHAGGEDLTARLTEAERRNLGRYGFGIKGFTLSMVETALEATENRVPGAVIAEMVAIGRELLAHPVHLLPGAEEAVRAMKAHGTIVLVTKGDLIDQERKLAQSGLGDLFDDVQIVSDKTPETYRRAFAGHGAALMVGNSMRSDVLPAIEAGAHGVHVPHDLTWAYEQAEAPGDTPRLHRIGHLGELEALALGLR